jgi:hypothetical protein
MSFEDEYVRRPVKKNPLNAYLPILGLILAVALGAIAFVLSEPLHTLLMDNFDTIPPDKEVQYAIGGITFFVFVLFAGLLYAAFSPKSEKTVSERELQKERVAKNKQKESNRKRKRKLNLKAAQEREASTKKRDRS